MFKDISLGQIRHGISGIGYLLVGGGVLTPAEAATGVDLTMTAIGAVIAVIGHFMSAFEKKKRVKEE